MKELKEKFEEVVQRNELKKNEELATEIADLIMRKGGKITAERVDNIYQIDEDDANILLKWIEKVPISINLCFKYRRYMYCVSFLVRILVDEFQLLTCWHNKEEEIVVLVDFENLLNPQTLFNDAICASISKSDPKNNNF